MSPLWKIPGESTAVFAALALLMGVIPGYELSRIPPGPNVKPLTPLEAEGREVYVANGCSYCHTQQVRPLAQDRAFGRPSAPGDFAYQTPELLGSERTGPDLTNVGVRQSSEVWQYLHLYQPRLVVPQSIMPSFDWLFRVVDAAPSGVASVPLPKAYTPAHGVVIPTHDAQALVAYLLSLKQPPLAGSGSEVPAGSGAAALVAKPPKAPSPPAGGAKPGSADRSVHGEQLFAANCAACHQATGEGLPGAFPPLRGDATVNDPNPTRQIHAVLFGLQGATVSGVQYASPMPPFASQLSDQEVADLIDYERAAWSNHGRPATAADVAQVRARGK